MKVLVGLARGGFVLSWVGGAMLAVASCSAPPPAAVGEAQGAVTATSGTTCAIGAACELHLFLPKGLKASETVMVAEQSVELIEQDDILLSPGVFGGVASGGTVQVGTRSRVGGASAIGQVTLRNRSEVHGALIASNVVKQGAVVAPPSFTRPVGAPSKVSWNVTFPAASGGSVRVARGGDRTLAPGRYGDVDVESRGTLRLRAGAYYVDSLQTDGDGDIKVDSSGGTVVFYVRTRLDHKGRMTASPRAGDVLIGYFGTKDVELQSGFAGWLVAPFAEVEFQPGGAEQGSFFALRLEVKPKVTIQRADLSRTGPGWGTISPVHTPGTGTVAPPAPVAAGLSPAQYRDAVLAYFTKLYNEGYDGPPIVVEAHPDDTGPQAVTAAIQTAAPGPTPSAPAGSVPATVPGGKPAIVAQFPRLDPAFVDPTPPAPPKTCALGLGAGLPSPLPAPGGGPPPVNQPFSVGQPRNDSKDFDAFFGVTGNTGYGVNPSDGFFAGMNGDFDAGIRMFGITADFLSAHVDGDIATNRSPKARGKAGVQILGANFGAWTFDPGTPSFHADLCGALCSTPRSLLPHPIDLPIGPVTVSVDAALEGELPADLVLGDGGPDFTIAPMVRAYAIVAGLIGVGLELGVEGQLDVLRVDIPIDARFNWAFDNSPNVCQATMNLDTGIKFRFSTLNGTLFLVARIDLFVGTIELFRLHILSFDGFVYESPRTKLVDVPMSVPLPTSLCQVDRDTCGTPPADLVLSDLGPEDQRAIITHHDYGQGRDQCKNQYIVEIPGDRLTGKTLLMFPGTTENDGLRWQCVKEKGAATLLKTFDGTNWLTENFFEWQGSQNPADATLEGGSQPGECKTERKFDDKPAPPGFNDPGQRVFVYHLEPGLKGVRLAVMATADCDPLPLSLTVGQSQFE